MMHLRLLILSTCVFIVTGVLFINSEVMAETAVLIYCDDNYPPYSYLEKGEIKGIYTEILSLAFSRMNDYAVKIKANPWKRGLMLLEKGTLFGLYPPYYRPEERPFMDYSVSILEEKLMVFTNEKVSEKRVLNSWPYDFYGLKIGKNRGFSISGNRDFLEAVKTGKIQVDESDTNRTNILKLGMGRLDVYVNDRLSILWELTRLKRSGEFDEGGRHSRIVEGIILSTEQGYLGFTNRDRGRFSFKDDFIKKFNQIIEEMKQNGEIEKIIVDGYLK